MAVGSIFFSAVSQEQSKAKTTLKLPLGSCSCFASSPFWVIIKYHLCFLCDLGFLVAAFTLSGLSFACYMEITALPCLNVFIQVCIKGIRVFSDN